MSSRAPPAARSERRFWLYLAPLLAYAGLIYYMSSLSKLPGLGAPGLDKVAHLLEYGLLGLLAARALRAYGAGPGRAVGLAVLIGSLYGVSDEIHQRFTPGRSADPADWVADTLGAAGGAGLWALVVRPRGPVGAR